MYNLEVKDLHNFLVGDVGVVVHNGCIKISSISTDWVKKGCHVHHGKTEVLILPNNNCGITFKKYFSSTTEGDFNEAVDLIEASLENQEFIKKLIDQVGKARDYMHGVTGADSKLAKGKAAELNFLLSALNKLLK